MGCHTARLVSSNLNCGMLQCVQLETTYAMVTKRATIGKHIISRCVIVSFPDPSHREEGSGRIAISELSKWNVIIYLKRHVECSKLFERHVLHDVTTTLLFESTRTA